MKQSMSRNLKQLDEIGEPFAAILYHHSEAILPIIANDFRQWWLIEVEHYIQEVERLTRQTAYRSKILDPKEIKPIKDANPRLALIVQGGLETSTVAGAEAGAGLLSAAVLDDISIPQSALLRIARLEARRVAGQVNKTTLKQIRGLVAGLVAQEGGTSIPEISAGIRDRFNGYSRGRAVLTARTESIKTLNQGSVEVWAQSGVVEKKEWYTTFDGRTCQWCPELHGRTYEIRETLFVQGETFVGNEGGALTFGFGDVETPPLHPLCRCALLPVL